MSRARARERGYIATYLHLLTRRSPRDHNTPGSLRPWTRLHLISRIVLNHRGSRGSSRILPGVVTVADCLSSSSDAAAAAAAKCSLGSNYWFSTYEYIIRRASAGASLYRCDDTDGVRSSARFYIILFDDAEKNCPWKTIYLHLRKKKEPSRSESRNFL